MRIAFATFGCKINQNDTDLMHQAVAGRGDVIVPFDSTADVYVINTCSVTGKSDYQCRQAIRAAVRRGASRVIVTGCYAETRPEELRAIPGVSVVLGNAEKDNILRHLPPSGAERAAGGQGKEIAARRTRGFLKIQDGCDSRCTYCIVPHARGASRSVPPQAVIGSFDRAVSAGAPEVVLSGIHIGKYGADLSPPVTLSGLVSDLLAGRRDARVRLSSIEPREVTDEIIGMLGNGLCRHLHIPLQSGDDEILRSMRRNYTAALYREVVTRVAERVPATAIGADVMVGFPGEEDRHFRNTLRLIEELPLTHLHVFSYSPRPGTPAAAMPGQISEIRKKERNEELRELGFRKNFAFRKTLLGSQQEVALEDKPCEEGYTGLTDNYIRVTLRGAKKEDIGTLKKVAITEILDQQSFGEILDK